MIGHALEHHQDFTAGPIPHGVDHDGHTDRFRPCDDRFQFLHSQLRQTAAPVPILFQQPSRAGPHATVCKQFQVAGHQAAVAGPGNQTHRARVFDVFAGHGHPAAQVQPLLPSQIPPAGKGLVPFGLAPHEAGIMNPGNPETVQHVHAVSHGVYELVLRWWVQL